MSVERYLTSRQQASVKNIYSIREMSLRYAKGEFAQPPKPKKSKQQLKRERRKSRRAEYNAYLKSPEWRALRITLFAQRGRRCEECGATSGEIHVHHLTYKRFKHERLEDVKLLCKACHKKKH